MASRFSDSPAFGIKLKRFLDIVVADYNGWHRKQRNLCDTNRSHARSLRLLVFRGSNVNYGLGDHFRGLLHSYLKAVASGRFFLIDMPKALPLYKMLRNPVLSNFTYDATVFSSEPEEESVVRGDSKFQDLGMYLKSSRVVFETSLTRLYVKHFLRIPEYYPHLPFSQQLKKGGLDKFEIEHSVVAPFLLQALFETSPSLLRTIREKDAFPGQPFLASHARLGQGLGETQSRFNFTKEGQTIRSVSTCFGRIVGLVAKHIGLNNVLVATDTQMALKWIAEGVRTEHARALVATIEGPVVHTSTLRGSEGTNESYEAYERAFVDLGLMARAQGLVALNSGFSRLAAWMGAHNDRNTIMFEPQVCPLLGIGARARCEEHRRFKEMRVRTLAEEKVISRWKVQCKNEATK
ncbi:unnamed protein product [Agarophyton chilense]